MSKTPSSQLKPLNYSGRHSTMLWYGAYQSMVLTVPKCIVPCCGTVRTKAWYWPYQSVVRFLVLWLGCYTWVMAAAPQWFPCIWFSRRFWPQCRISYTVQCRKSGRNALTVSVKCRKCGILAIVDRQAWIISEIKNMYFYFVFRLVCTIFDPWSR